VNSDNNRAAKDLQVMYAFLAGFEVFRKRIITQAR
jgi:hypothetical protein